MLLCSMLIRSSGAERPAKKQEPSPCCVTRVGGRRGAEEGPPAIGSAGALQGPGRGVIVDCGSAIRKLLQGWTMGDGQAAAHLLGWLDGGGRGLRPSVLTHGRLASFSDATVYIISCHLALSSKHGCRRQPPAGPLAIASPYNLGGWSGCLECPLPPPRTAPQPPCPKVLSAYAALVSTI